MAEILSVFDAARGIMRASGNLHQWSEGYPSSEAVLSDIARGGAYLVCPSGGGISPADSAPRSGGGISPADSAPRSGGGIPPADFAPRSGGGIPPADSAPRSGGGISPADSAPRSGGGISPADHRQVEAYFAMLPSPEPTYDKIYDGAWLDDSLSYHVIHRIASYPDSHGIFRDIIRFASAMDSNLRIDTHADNHIMQHLIMEYGFSYCGVIYLADGSPRLAYQRLSSGGQATGGQATGGQTTGGQASARKG